MATTKDKEIIAAAERLYELRCQRLEIEKEEARLKDRFKGQMGEVDVLIAGEYCVETDQASRTDWNGEALYAHFGDEGAQKFRKVSTFTKIEIKKLKGRGAA